MQAGKAGRYVGRWVGGSVVVWVGRYKDKISKCRRRTRPHHRKLGIRKGQPGST